MTLEGGEAEIRSTLDSLARRMSNLAARQLGTNEPDQRAAALAWLERAAIVTRLLESLPQPGARERIAPFPWRLERRTDL